MHIPRKSILHPFFVFLFVTLAVTSPTSQALCAAESSIASQTDRHEASLNSPERLPDGHARAVNPFRAVRVNTETGTPYGDNLSGTEEIKLLQHDNHAEANVVAGLPHETLEPRHLTRTTPLDGLRILVPDEESWLEIGRFLTESLSRATRSTIHLEAVGPGDLPKDWNGNVLVVGNLANNRYMARLYGMRMSFADAIYPGPGGYNLQTVVDPFGRGGNTIVLGATDVAGAQKGAERLLEIVAAHSEAVLPWLAEAELALQTRRLLPYAGRPNTFQIQGVLRSVDEWLAALRPNPDVEKDIVAVVDMLSRIASYGEYYQLTGDEGFGTVYKALLLGFSDYLLAHPNEAQAQLNQKNMWTVGDSVIAGWTVMEASPIFSDEERRKIVRALFLIYEANARDGFLARIQPQAPRWNHEIYPALSLVAGGHYFVRYYNLPEAARWVALGDMVFEGNTAVISLDEGPDYLLHVPLITIDYAMHRGATGLIERTLRPSADLQALLINNIGTMSGGGDNYPLGHSGAYSWGHSQVMNVATWYYGDPVYKLLLERTLTGTMPRQNTPDLNYPIHRYATDSDPGPFDPQRYPKVAAMPLDEGIYKSVRASLADPEDVPADQAFHKLAFRFGFGVDDAYLALDGFSGGTHGHQDGNAIIGYTQNGRLLLTDQDYIENTPEHHNGIVVVKDGGQHAKPVLSRLEWVADLGEVAVSRSTVPQYNGTHWHRTILSPGGTFFLIFDEIEIVEKGRFAFKNMWQTLGEPVLQADRLTVEQNGITMTIQSLDASQLQIHERHGHFQKYFKSNNPYPFAEREVILSQVLTESEYQPGDVVQYINLLSSERATSPSIYARRLGADVIEVHAGSSRWLAVPGPLQDEGFVSDGVYHVLHDDLLIALQASEVRASGEQLRFAEPVHFVLNVADGAWCAHRLRRNLLAYDESGNPVAIEPLACGNLDWGYERQQGLMSRLASEAEWEKPEALYPDPNVVWQPLYIFPDEVSHAAVGDLFGDGNEALIIGGKSGLVHAVSSSGDLLWSFQAFGRVNEVSVQPVLGRPTVFVATELWSVYALTGAGELLWSARLPSDAAHRELKGNLLGITNVRVAHLEGKSEDPWIMVGTQFRYLYGLDLKGSERFKIAFYYYGLEDMEFADLDGDGIDEGIIGLEYSSYIHLKSLKENRYGTGQGPGWKVVEIIPQAGSGLPQVLLGTKQGRIHAARERAGRMQELWQRNVGGEVNAIAHIRFGSDDPGAILVGTSGLQFYNLGIDGSVQWRVPVPARVLHVAAWQDGSKRFYVAALDQGLFYLVDRRGGVAGFGQLPEEIVALLTVGGTESLFAVLEDGSVHRLLEMRTTEGS